MTIQRHCVCASGYGEGYLVPHPLGEAVEYDDHVEVVNVLQEQLNSILQLLEQEQKRSEDWKEMYYELLREIK